jgi:uncharacterized protein YoxC
MLCQPNLQKNTTLHMERNSSVPEIMEVLNDDQQSGKNVIHASSIQELDEINHNRQSSSNVSPQNQSPQNQSPQNQSPQNQSPQNQSPQNQSPNASTDQLPNASTDQLPNASTDQLPNASAVNSHGHHRRRSSVTLIDNLPSDENAQRGSPRASTNITPTNFSPTHTSISMRHRDDRTEGETLIEEQINDMKLHEKMFSKSNYFIGVCILILCVIFMCVYYINIDHYVKSISSAFDELVKIFDNIDMDLLNNATGKISNISDSLNSLSKLKNLDIDALNNAVKEIPDMVKSLKQLAKFTQEIDTAGLNKSIKLFPEFVKILTNISKLGISISNPSLQIPTLP